MEQEETNEQLKSSEINNLNWCWSPPVEDIDGIVYTKFSHDIQSHLNCIVGKQVFLEYPWAFVNLKDAQALARQVGSGLECCKDRINDYKMEYLLVGYACRNQLISTDFVVCCTIEARDFIFNRNREISRSIIRNVHRMTIVQVQRYREDKSILDVIEETKTIKLTHEDSVTSRSLFEVDISLLTKSTHRHPRKLANRNSDDAYTDLISSADASKYNSILMKQISKSVYTTLPPCQKSVQLFLDHPKNKWAQSYTDAVCDDAATETDNIDYTGDNRGSHSTIRTVQSNKQPDLQQQESQLSGTKSSEKRKSADANNQEKIEIPVEHQTLELDKCLTDVIDTINYNANINTNADDIENFSVNNRAVSYSAFADYNDEYCELFNQSCYLIYQAKGDIRRGTEITNVVAISDVSWHPSIFGLIAISYVSGNYPLGTVTQDTDHHQQMVDNLNHTTSVKSNDECKVPHIDKNNTVLIWSIQSDLISLQPLLCLDDYRQVVVISFCPFKFNNVVVGGCNNGQLILWDLDDDNLLIKQLERNIKNFGDKKTLTASVVCSSSLFQPHYHLSSIRAIHWLPPKYAIKRNEPKKKDDNSIVEVQFVTSSEDGTVIIWVLQQFTSAIKTDENDDKKWEYKFQGLYQVNIPLPNGLNMTILTSCFYFSNDDSNLDDKNNVIGENGLPTLWISSAQGQLAVYTWHGHELEQIGDEDYSADELFSRNEVIDWIHDAPVVKVISSHHLRHMLLTIGGHVFAIWCAIKCKHPLMWRKSDNRYTACCWTNTPGIFILARCDGDLEIWDIYRKMKQPIHIQPISLTGKLITGLVAFTHKNSWPSLSRFVIGVCHQNGTFRYITMQTQLNRRHHHEYNQHHQQENLDRIAWLDKFIERQIKYKNEFHAWQEKFLSTDKTALERRERRHAEEIKRRREEERFKLLKKYEDKSAVKPTKKKKRFFEKTGEQFFSDNLERMKSVLVEKQRYNFEEIDKLRYPLVQQEEEKVAKLNRVDEKLAIRDNYYSNVLAIRFPEYNSKSYCENYEKVDMAHNDMEIFVDQETMKKHMDDYLRIKNIALEIIDSNKNNKVADKNSN